MWIVGDSDLLNDKFHWLLFHTLCGFPFMTQNGSSRAQDIDYDRGCDLWFFKTTTAIPFQPLTTIYIYICSVGHRARIPHSNSLAAFRDDHGPHAIHHSHCYITTNEGLPLRFDIERQKDRYISGDEALSSFQWQDCCIRCTSLARYGSSWD